MSGYFFSLLDSTEIPVGVVLLNWGGTPLTDLKFKVLNGIANPATSMLTSGEPLHQKNSSSRTNAVTLTLHEGMC